MEFGLLTLQSLVGFLGLELGPVVQLFQQHSARSDQDSFASQRSYHYDAASRMPLTKYETLQVNDEDIIEGRPIDPKPLSVRTDMSYHLARLRFAEISQRQIWQANASPHPPYSFM